MIVTIFKKSKPINLVIAALLVVLGFLLAQLEVLISLKTEAVFSKIPPVLVLIFSVLVVDFIVKKNSLSKQNSFVILFLSLFSFYYWGDSYSNNLLVANLFILLGLRKIISLKSQKDTTRKIFDAALWICIATIFSFWSVLFLVVLYVGILIHSANYYKNWLVPLVSVLVVFIIVNSFQLFFYGNYFKFNDDYIDLNFNALFAIKKAFPIALISLISLISLVFLMPSISKKTQKNKSSYTVLVFALFVAISIFIVIPRKGVEHLVFTYFPLACLFTVFFERISKKAIQSLVVYILLLAPIVYHFL